MDFCGEAQEDSCWLKIQKLSYDGWYGRIGKAAGLMTTHSLGGRGMYGTRFDDMFTDFAQLTNGNLALK